MKCPYCSHNESKVVDKRESGKSQEITRRRRECLGCNKRFTTYESVEHVEVAVIKKDKSRELFDRNKILSGLLRACEKRHISIEQLNALIDNVRAEVASHESQEIESTKLGDIIMKHLQQLDKVAYIRFASVYREFADIEQFKNELIDMLEKKK